MITKATVHFNAHTQTYLIEQVDSITLDGIGLLTITYKEGTKKCFLNMPVELTMDDT